MTGQKYEKLREDDEITLDVALQDVARRAGHTLRKHAFDMGSVTMKHDDDPVSSLDKRVEREIRENVANHMHANFIGEELGEEMCILNKYTWIIDPIDGTKSMLRGEFNTSLSIAIEKAGHLVAGCVYDFMRDIMYIGYHEQLKVIYNGKEVTAQKIPETKKRVIIDGPGVRDLDITRFLEEDGAKLIEKNGSIALAMAQVAAGVYDGMVYQTNNKWNVWDIAAGYYLLTCTGCVLDLDLKKKDYARPHKGIVGLGKDINPLYLAEHVR